MPNSAFAQYWRLAFLLFVVLAPFFATADNIPVRFTEGISRGFLVVTDLGGHRIGQGDDEQVLHGSEIHNHLIIRFKDGSLYDETTVFTQQKTFRLISDHLIEKGPSFKTPIDGLIDASTGQVIIHYIGKTQDKAFHKKMKLPPDIANGMLFVLVKDFDPKSLKTTMSYLSLGEHPRLVKLVFTPKGKNPFETGGVRRDAVHYVMHVDIGGIAGALAPLVGKQPHDTDIWVIGGDAPTYAGSVGPLYGDGPVWRISLVSPEAALEEGDGRR